MSFPIPAPAPVVSSTDVAPTDGPPTDPRSAGHGPPSTVSPEIRAPIARPGRAPRGMLWGAAALVVAAASGVAVLGIRRSTSARTDAADRTSSVALGPIVRTATVALSPPVRHLTLLGEARPYAEVTLYAKVSGYLRNVRVDRGDRVRAGQVLATIESPETDRAYAGARAEYEQRRVTAERVQSLLAQQFVSTQEADQARADAAIARERMAALGEQQGYQSLRAPFDGTVTARYADPGALLQSAAASQTAALPVLTVSQIDRLRVFVYLDPSDAAAVRPGTTAVLSTDDRPDARVPARVTRVSGLLDPKTRKMLAELDVDDRDGAIVPGGFVQVTLDVPAPARLEAPAEALVTRGTTTSVGVVDSAGRVHLVPVRVANNDGRLVTFATGVTPGTRVALSLGGAVADGARVRVAPDSAVLATRAAR